MPNQYVNKVIYGGNTLIDLTADTATADKVLSGFTMHDATGASVTGSCTYDANTQDATASVAEVLATKTFYAQGTKKTGTMTNVGSQVSTITTKAQQVTIANGYHDGSGKVSIDAVESAKIIPSNILQGVSILGVVGSVQPSSEIEIESSKTVTPTVAGFTVTPSTGYDAMAQVEVRAIPYTETDNASGGKTVSIATA